MTATLDGFADIRGPRTPYAGPNWPVRIDRSIEEHPDRWVRAACSPCSNGCGIDIGVKDDRPGGRFAGMRGREAEVVNRGRLAPKGLLLALILVLPALCARAHAQIVAFGASNVAGKNVAAREAFPAQLRAMLREKGYTVSVLNAGISGDTTSEMRRRVDTDIPAGTALVILDSCGGYHNDEQNGISRDQGDADMAAIGARLKERGIKVVPVCAADLGREYRQQDGVHLTPEGYKLLARALLPSITEQLGPPTGPTLSVREACAPDARRLCANALGDDAKRHACMQEHRSQLSRDCLHAIAESRRQ